VQRVIGQLQELLEGDLSFVPAVLDALANMQLDQELQVSFAADGKMLCLTLSLTLHDDKGRRDVLIPPDNESFELSIGWRTYFRLYATMHGFYFGNSATPDQGGAHKVHRLYHSKARALLMRRLPLVVVNSLHILLPVVVVNSLQILLPVVVVNGLQILLRGCVMIQCICLLPKNITLSVLVASGRGHDPDPPVATLCRSG
jgi:hypothetical protein